MTEQAPVAQEALAHGLWSDAVAFLDRVKTEDWSLDWLVANAMASVIIKARHDQSGPAAFSEAIVALQQSLGETIAFTDDAIAKLTVERKLIARWLQDEAAKVDPENFSVCEPYDAGWHYALNFAAESIERGDHLSALASSEAEGD